MAHEQCPDVSTILCACAGDSNAGQAANQAAIDLHIEGIGRILCREAVAQRNEDMLSSGRRAERIVGIDGCAAACTKKTLEQAGLPVTDHVVVTDLGIRKRPHNDILDTRCITRIKNAVKARLESIPDGPFCS
jgi:uncharacterized metal-binding protein